MEEGQGCGHVLSDVPTAGGGDEQALPPSVLRAPASSQGLKVQGPPLGEVLASL